MAQYHPMYRARMFPEINRRVTQREYDQALEWAREAGLKQYVLP
jgi:putative pyruvate formate lyase activating enzyme